MPDNRLQTTDNGGQSRLRNYGTTEARNYGNWLRFAMPDNRLQTTDNGGQSRHSELRNYGLTELWKLASLCYAGRRTTDNRQRRAKPAQSSWLVAHSLSVPFVPLYTFYPFRLLPLALSLLSDSEAQVCEVIAEPKILQHYKRSDTIFFCGNGKNVYLCKLKMHIRHFLKNALQVICGILTTQKFQRTLFCLSETWIF